MVEAIDVNDTKLIFEYIGCLLNFDGEDVIR